MQPARLLLGFLFMTAWLAGLARFKAFFHSSTLAVVLMAYVFVRHGTAGSPVSSFPPE